MFDSPTLDSIEVPKRVVYVIPIFYYPLLLCFAMHGPYYTAFGFMFTMYAASMWSQFRFYRKKRNHLIISLLICSMIYTYFIYMLYFFPYYNIPLLWLLIQHICLILFVLFLHLTVQGPIQVIRFTNNVSFVSPADVLMVDDNDKPIQPYQVPVRVTDERVIDVSIEEQKRPIRSKGTTTQITQGPYWPVANSDWSYCSLCEYLVPPRSGHCRTCEKCFYKLDHHCFWLDTCIALNNERWFIGLVSTMAFGLLFNSYLVLKTICPNEGWTCPGIYQYPDRVPVFCSTIFTLLVGFSILYPLLRALISASYNVTMLDVLSYFSARYSRDADVSRSRSWLLRYNRGFFANWYSVLFPIDVNTLHEPTNVQVM